MARARLDSSGSREPKLTTKMIARGTTKKTTSQTIPGTSRNRRGKTTADRRCRRCGPAGSRRGRVLRAGPSSGTVSPGSGGSTAKLRASASGTRRAASGPRSSSSCSFAIVAWSGFTLGSARIAGSMYCLGRRVRAHVVDEVRVVRADLGVEHVVDEEVGGDRVLRAREDGHRVGAADAALLGDVVDDVLVGLLDGVDVGAPDLADPVVACSTSSRGCRSCRRGRAASAARAARAPRRARPMVDVLAS